MSEPAESTLSSSVGSQFKLDWVVVWLEGRMTLISGIGFAGNIWETDLCSKPFHSGDIPSRTEGHRSKALERRTLWIFVRTTTIVSWDKGIMKIMKSVKKGGRRYAIKHKITFPGLHDFIVFHLNWLIMFVCIFSCPEQLNRWPCHSLTDSLTHSQYFYFWHTKSDPRDLWPLRHLIRVMRRHDTCDNWDMWSAVMIWHLGCSLMEVHR